MFGIYCFKNKLDEKRYIGQSINLEERKKSHLRNYKNKNHNAYNSYFYNALRKYGEKNFKYSVLYSAEYLTKEELNALEIYYIWYYDSYNCGYNMNIGGNYTSSKKVLDEDSLRLIQLYLQDTDLPFYKIAILFKVSDSLISMINSGKIWKIQELKYPLRVVDNNIGGKNPNSKLTDSVVLEMRKKFQKESLNSIYNNYKNLASFSSIKKAVYGASFRHLPVYKKRDKQWYLNETCIDYPRLVE